MKRALLIAVAVLGVGLYSGQSAQAQVVSWGFSYSNGYYGHNHFNNNFHRGGYCGPRHGGFYGHPYGYYGPPRGYGGYYSPYRGNVNFYRGRW